MDYSMCSKLSSPEGESFGLSSTGIMQLARPRLLLLKFIFQVVLLFGFKSHHNAWKYPL